MARKYQHLWERIKRQDRCVVEVKHPAFVKTIKEGVMKEKNHDLGFKVMNDTEPFRLRIVYDAETRRLEFTLTQRLGMAEKVMT